MNNYQGIIFAYKSYPELRELVAERTAASLPICSRYRLIDFSLSSLRNAGIVDVGVIMQRDYQSLLDHLGSGKPWDMSRRTGGLRMLPPFGLPAHHRGDYSGTIEALNAVSSYIEEIPKKYIVLMIGNLCANQVPSKVFEYIATGKPILNFYSIENDTSLIYLNRYPAVLSAKSADGIGQDDLLRIYDGGRQIGAETLREIYADCLCENVVRRFASFLNTVSGNTSEKE